MLLATLCLGLALADEAPNHGITTDLLEATGVPVSLHDLHRGPHHHRLKSFGKRRVDDVSMPEETAVRCDTVTHVGANGKPVDVYVSACAEPYRSFVAEVMEGQRWKPLKGGVAPRPFLFHTSMAFEPSGP